MVCPVQGYLVMRMRMLIGTIQPWVDRKYTLFILYVFWPLGYGHVQSGRLIDNPTREGEGEDEIDDSTATFGLRATCFPFPIRTLSSSSVWLENACSIIGSTSSHCFHYVQTLQARAPVILIIYSLFRERSKGADSPSKSRLALF